MKLVVGQNILIEKMSCVEIDFAWRSLKSDLNLSIHAFAFNNGKVVTESKVDANKLPLPDAVSQDDSGRHFSVQFPQLSVNIDRIAFYGFLPENSHYSLQQMSSFQIRINDSHAGRIATMDVDAFNNKSKSALFFEFYKHNNVWKLGYKAQAFNADNIKILAQLGLSVIQPDAVKSVVKDAAISPENHIKLDQQYTRKVDVLDNVDLKKGQNLSLSEHFKYCTAITCEVNVVPKIDDLALNVIAINRDNKVNNIKDFLYQENTMLRGDGVKLGRRDVTINLEQIPADVTKIQLLVTRRSSSKRINSADFIELSLTNTYTEQKIAKYVSETNDKNYNTMVLLNFYRSDKGWSVRAVGQGFSGGLDKIGERYQFSPPKLRNMRSSSSQQNSFQQNPSHENSFDQHFLQQSRDALEIGNKVFIDKHKKMQSLSYFLMGIAALLLLLTFSRVLFFPLACLLAGLGWYLFQNASKALKSIQNEQFERLVLIMIKANNYLLTPFEIATNCKVSIERATEMLDYLCDKGLGQTAVNRKGAIYYDFSSLKNLSN